jgi:hypothetical protein
MGPGFRRDDEAVDQWFVAKALKSLIQPCIRFCACAFWSGVAMRIAVRMYVDVLSV